MKNTEYERKKVKGHEILNAHYDNEVSDFMRSLYEVNTNAPELGHLKNSLRVCIEEELTPRQREVLIMRYFQGLNGAEIAEALGVNKSTVCRTLHRAEEHLRKVLRYTSPRLLKIKKE